MLSRACSEPPLSFTFPGGEDPHPLDGSRGHRVPQVLLGQRCVELWNSHVGGAGLRRAALLEHDQPGRECCQPAPPPTLPRPAWWGLRTGAQGSALASPHIPTGLCTGCMSPLWGEQSIPALHSLCLCSPVAPRSDRSSMVIDLPAGPSQSCPIPGDTDSSPRYECKQGGHCHAGCVHLGCPQSCLSASWRDSAHCATFPSPWKGSGLP